MPGDARRHGGMGGMGGMGGGMGGMGGMGRITLRRRFLVVRGGLKLVMPRKGDDGADGYRKQG